MDTAKAAPRSVCRWRIFGTPLRIGRAETLTIASDGVVETRDTNGELLGFERTLELSVLSAAQIAETAETFGQQDDITVLKLTLTVPEETMKWLSVTWLVTRLLSRPRTRPGLNFAPNPGYVRVTDYSPANAVCDLMSGSAITRLPFGVDAAIHFQDREHMFHTLNY